ncbi:MAG: helix-turn-helix domain-containing protein [Coriobacteriia bacterium]|nr:helix-turn-helix domain-containing protein [Coriobacteriia bacterium]
MATANRGAVLDPANCATWPELMTVEQFQIAHNIGRTTAYELLRTGEVDHVKVGRRKYVVKRALLARLGITIKSGEANG